MSDTVKEFLERDEAVKALKRLYRPGCTYFVCVNGFIYTELAEGDKAGRGYETYAHIVVSQKQAIKYVMDVFGRSGKWVDEKCKIRIDSSTEKDKRGGCIFIG